MFMVSLVKEYKALLKSPVPVVTWAVVTVLVSYAGPFGTFNKMPFQLRLAYWATVVAVSILLGLAVRLTIRRLMQGYGYWPMSGAIAVAMAVMLSGPLTWFSARVSTGLNHSSPALPEMFFLVFVVSLGVSAVRRILAGNSVAPEITPIEPRLMRRIAPPLQGRLIRCSVFDHYVLVVTDKGESKLLLRFSDALDELEGADGLQVHRSHWVATDAVTGHEMEKGRLMLLLEDCSRVPVSRNYRGDVEARGLI
ncbi:MAG: DNA-binding protein [Confluentimicrobium sp.]|nr:DNA-binding protein [Actibacterium sp.]